MAWCWSQWLSLWLSLSLWLLLAGVGAAAPPPAGQLLELRSALRSLPGQPPVKVALPDALGAESGPGELRPTYTLDVDLGPAPSHVGVYLPGLLNRASVRINGHLVFDSLGVIGPASPRGADRLLFEAIPDEFVHAGSNRLEITLWAPRWTSLSEVFVGPEEVVRGMYISKRWWQVYAPVVIAAIILALSACVLLLWLRERRQTLYAYFGAGGVVWSLHNVWGVMPDPLLPYPHFAIWYSLGFGYFVAPIVVFCVRLAQWRVPRFEKTLWVSLAVGPVLVYAAKAVGLFDPALTVWRLGCVVAVGVGVLAVGKYAFGRRDLHSAFLLLAGATAFAFGAHDWWIARYSSGSNPVLLTQFSGLVFFPLVAWMLIDGFVQTSRQLERLNVDLERRVALKSAELLHALDEMRAAKDAAEAANRAKSSFLAAASHDLRQPMHALSLYMAALRGETLGAEQADLVAHMSASVVALDSLFDALLDVSRIDAGAVQPAPRAFEVEPMLHRLTEDFARQAADKGLRLSLRVAPAARRMYAYSDPLLVERIVRNLLANAVKYTVDGGVLLACRVRDADAPQPRWRIEVWDSGPGIPAAERERVFEEFYQLGNPERDRAAGLGLGLSIVRRLAHLLGHPVALQSMPGHGSRFTIDLPATSARPVVAPEAAPRGAIDGMGVAVIDDDPDVRHGMTALLTRWGCDVLAGASAEDVLERAGARPALRLHAAVVDFQLRNGQTGVDAIRVLRGVCGEAMPVLVVSGASSAEKLAELRASGLDWLSKPVPAARLHAWLVQAAGIALWDRRERAA